MNFNMGGNLGQGFALALFSLARLPEKENYEEEKKQNQFEGKKYQNSNIR
jgi:hypothetical protein